MIEVRRATSTDAPAIASVHVASWRAAYRDLLPQAVLDSLSVEARTRLWHLLLARPELDTLVVGREHIAGFCNLSLSRDADSTPTTGEVTALYVDPTYWRLGLGQLLVDAAIARALERGFDHLTLWVLRDNGLARSFYEALNFRSDGCARVDADLGLSLDELRYALELDQSA